MSFTIIPRKGKRRIPALHELFNPLKNTLEHTPTLKARGHRPLQMNFEQQVKALVFYHLEEHSSARHLMQVLEEDNFARKEIAPPEGIKKKQLL